MLNSYRLSYIFLFPLLLLSCGFFWGNPSWQEIDKTIRHKYPAVKNIEIETLKTAIDQGDNITLIDVREDAEFLVSHLPGAIHITEIAAINYPKNTHLVIYCSVGLRSAEFAEKLTSLGYSRVFNLRGSIFAWANKGYPLMRHQKKVRTVHPYNKKWGQLLDRKLHQYQVNSQ